MREKVLMVAAGLTALSALATEVRSEEIWVWTGLTVIEAHAKGNSNVLDLGVKGDSPGDMTAWHVPVLDRAKKAIGTSNGFCVRTVPGKLSECRRTLTMSDGTITLASAEAEKGISPASVTGGTNAYLGVSGEAAIARNADGTCTIVMKLKKKKEQRGGKTTGRK